MIVPVIAYPIARSAPVKRVQRKDDLSDADAVVGDAPDPVSERGGGRQRRPRPRVMAYADDTPVSKSSVGVLIALGALTLGG